MIGPIIIGSNYLSQLIIGFDGSENTNSSRAKFIVEFLWTFVSFLRINLIISITDNPAVTATVLTTLGIISAALIKTLNLSTGSIL